MRKQYKKHVIIASTLLFAPSVMFAAETTTANRDTGNYNITLMLLVGLSMVLLFVIGALAGVQSQLSEICKEKYQAKNAKGVIKTVLLLLALGAMAAPAMAAPTEVTPKAATAIINGVSDTDFYMIMGFIIFEFSVIFMQLFSITKLQNAISNKAELENTPDYIAAQEKKSWFWDKFNNAASIEKEKDILLNHNYDGIQELDNSLPPWWKYGFYITIVAACIYFYRFQISGTGLNSKEEYAQEMQQGEEEKAAYLAKAGNSVDENTVTLLTDPTSLAEGKEIYLKTCMPCHLADGGGVVGPNLTDDYWLHGGSIKDIFKTIKYGYQEKGMKSWKDDFSPKQIQELASFVKSLKGTKPAVPKAPQGDLYVEATTTAKVDSVAVKK